ncbi:hypothetical protein OUZ56_030964 [Daphnia magna]|uniref:Latrophilin Cirl n=1 Tax=Daphnia magna TaxID=35525 RepID=A0ABQ9ZTQ0_9CRUS|nr:hypothetical protein OUZ56_030964 [Daphnia magna]
MLTLSCSENNEVINLLRANYGRFSITICNEHGDTDWSVNCMSHRSLRALHSKCNQQTNCSILASTNVFGDPCPGTLKYLEAHYQCVPATPTSSTARPRPPWFSSVGPSIWNTLGLQNATVSTTTTSNPVVLSTSTEQADVGAVLVNNSTSQSSTTAILEQSNGTSTTAATLTTSSTTGKPSTTTTTSTTTPLPNLLVELTEVTVLVPDFPGRRPQSSSSSSTPLPPSTSTLSVSGVEDDQDLVGLDDVVVAVDKENGEDQNGDLITTPGSSTTAASSSRPKSSSDNKSQRPPGGVDHNMYCQPAVTRGLYWNWTRSGDHVVQPCPGGATGYARWFCSAGQGPAAWYPSSPDLSECKSVWLTSLDSRIGEGDSIISIANDLAQVTHSKTLYGGDMMAAARLLRQMALKMAADLQAFPDWRQREAIVTELVQSVVRAGSSLLGSAQSLAWRDLGLTTPPVGAGAAALPPPPPPPSPPSSSSSSSTTLNSASSSSSADADDMASDPHYYATQQRDQHARTTATALLTGLEENAFLLANTISRQKSVFQSFDNILMSVRVLDMRNINELSFPSAEELQVWKSKEDWITLPAEALLENSDNGLVRVVLFAYEHMEDILSPASMNHQQHNHHHSHRDQPTATGGSVSSPNRQQQQQAAAAAAVWPLFGAVQCHPHRQLSSDFRFARQGPSHPAPAAGDDPLPASETRQCVQSDVRLLGLHCQRMVGRRLPGAGHQPHAHPMPLRSFDQLRCADGSAFDSADVAAPTSVGHHHVHRLRHFHRLPGHGRRHFHPVSQPTEIGPQHDPQESLPVSFAGRNCFPVGHQRHARQDRVRPRCWPLAFLLPLRLHVDAVGRIPAVRHAGGGVRVGQIARQVVLPLRLWSARFDRGRLFDCRPL